MDPINSCDYLLGENDSIVILVPDRLPKDAPLTIELGRDHFTIRAGAEAIGEVDCPDGAVMSRLMSRSRVGLVDAFNERPKVPLYISAVADVRHVETAPVPG